MIVYWKFHSDSALLVMKNCESLPSFCALAMASTSALLIHQVGIIGVVERRARAAAAVGVVGAAGLEHVESSRKMIILPPSAVEVSPGALLKKPVFTRLAKKLVAVVMSEKLLNNWKSISPAMSR